jgi:hypothetical protein
MTWTELSQLMTPVGVLAGVWVSYRNGQKLNEVHRTNTSLAKQLGVEEGRKSERENPS